ncbi:MAG: type IV secretion system protein [Rickettsiales bacterium]
MRKYKYIPTYLLLFVVTFVSSILPFYAFAYNIPATPPTIIMYEDPATGVKTPADFDQAPPPPNFIRHVCPASGIANIDYGFITRLIPCIRDTITYATDAIISPFSKFIYDSAVLAVFVIAIALFGIRLFDGNGISATKDGIILALKIGAIIIFLRNFGGLYNPILDIVEQLLNMMATPIAGTSSASNIGVWQDTNCAVPTNFAASEQQIMEVWHILDCYIEVFVGGIFSPLTISSGILGLAVSALFSGSMGLFIGLIGVYMVLSALFAIARVVYIFIIAYIAISFMVIISPMFIPTILFSSTKHMFEGWLRLMLTFIIQPIFLFAYLVMFLVAFNVTILHGQHSLYFIISRGDVLTDPNYKLGNWINQKGGYTEKLLAKDDIKVDIKQASINDGFQFLKKEETATQGIQGEKHNDIFGYGGINPLSFFEIGIPITVIDWKKMAIAADPAGFAAVITQQDEEKFYQDYLESVFLGFIMAALVMYVFYSLIGYIPYIGSASMGHVGRMPTLGVGNLRPPGSRFFTSAR